MKKHLPVLALWARIHLRKVLGLLLLMVLFEGVLFGWRLHRTGEPPPAAESLLPGIPLICGITFLALLFLLSWGGGSSPATGCTLGRLSIPEEGAVLWQAVFNALCLLLFWAVQTAAALALLGWYAASLPPEYRSGQTVFLALYRSNFLHNLLPLDHWTRYLRNGVLALSLGFAAGAWTYKLRRGSTYGWWVSVVLGSLAWAAFTGSISNWVLDVMVSLAALAVAWADAWYLYNGWRGDLDET